MGLFKKIRQFFTGIDEDKFASAWKASDTQNKALLFKGAYQEANKNIDKASIIAASTAASILVSPALGAAVGEGATSLVKPRDVAGSPDELTLIDSGGPSMLLIIGGALVILVLLLSRK